MGWSVNSTSGSCQAREKATWGRPNAKAPLKLTP
jgi:hypothetical protein